MSEPLVEFDTSKFSAAQSPYLVDGTTANPYADVIPLSSQGIQYIDNLFYEVDTRFNALSVYVPDMREAKARILSDVLRYANPYAEADEDDNCPRPDKVACTLASGLMVGLHANTLHDAPHLLDTRVFTYGRFTKSELSFLRDTVTYIGQILRSSLSSVEVADLALRQALAAAEHDTLSGLTRLTLRAMQVGATIDDPDLSSDYFARFMADLPRAS